MFYQIGNLLINPQNIISAQLHLTKLKSGETRTSLSLKFASTEDGKTYSKHFTGADAEELWSALSEDVCVINPSGHAPTLQAISKLNQ